MELDNSDSESKRGQTTDPPPGAAAAEDETRMLLSSAAVTKWIEQEVDFRVREALQGQRNIQYGALALILLVACVGIALTANAYSKLQDTKAKNDRISLLLAQVEAILQSTGSADKVSAAVAH